MNYQVLARKWRPRRFEDLVGQTHVVRALSNALAQGRLHHAYLFAGTRGVGKTTIARILTKCLNCEDGVTASPCGECASCTTIDQGRFMDLIEVDAASRTRVEETRELLDNVQYAPTHGRYKVYLIDEVHMFSNHSFNALLKTLEEPPAHVKFLLATTDPKKLPVTILSRCLQFNLKRLSRTQIERQLQRILAQESVETDAESLRLIAVAADGSLRDALSLLDQAIAYGDGKLVSQQVAAMLGTVGRDQVLTLIDLLAAKDANGLLEHIERMAELDPDYPAVLGELLSQLQRIAVRQLVPAAADGDGADDERLKELANKLSPEDCQLYYQIALLGRRDLPFNADLRSGFEMVLLRMLAFTPETGGKPGKRRGEAIPQSTGDADLSSGARQKGGLSWSEVIERLALTGLVKELASNCVLERREGNEFYLLLPSNYLRNKNTEARLEAALREHFGSDTRVRFTLSPASDLETPNVIKTREAEERIMRAKAAIASDANVRRLCEAFDATIEAESIRAREDGEAPPAV